MAQALALDLRAVHLQQPAQLAGVRRQHGRRVAPSARPGVPRARSARRRRAPARPSPGARARAQTHGAVAAPQARPQRQRSAALLASSTSSTPSAVSPPSLVGQASRHQLRAAPPSRGSAAGRRVRTPSRSPRPARMLACADICGAPVSPREPPATSTCPLMNFVEDAPRRGSTSSTGLRSGRSSPPPGRRGGCRCRSSRTAPACALPGWIHSPGFEAWKVDRHRRVHCPRRTATPVEASTPLGTSTLTTGAAASLMRLDRLPHRSAWLALEAGAEQRVHDNRRASVSAAARAARDPRVELQRRLARQSLEARAGVARELLRGRAHTTVTSRPASRSSRATTSPSPPLFPFPHTTATGPSGTRRSTIRATPAPARSISSSEGPRAPRSPSGRRPHRRGVGQGGRQPSGAGDFHEQRS